MFLLIFTWSTPQLWKAKTGVDNNCRHFDFLYTDLAAKTSFSLSWLIVITQVNKIARGDKVHEKVETQAGEIRVSEKVLCGGDDSLRSYNDINSKNELSYLNGFTY